MGKFLVVIIIIVGVGVGMYFLFQTPSSDNENSYNAAEVLTGAADIKIKENADKDLAIAKAYELYRQAIFDGTDLSQGPCLSNKVIDGWVADIAHDPRQDVDNDPANQCSAYRSGEAKHFVELDPSGALIRAE